MSSLSFQYPDLLPLFIVTFAQKILDMVLVEQKEVTKLKQENLQTIHSYQK